MIFLKIEKIVIKLICKKLGLKKYEKFRFTNQNTNDIYYFDDLGLNKTITWCGGKSEGATVKSGVSLNWLLDPDCKIVKVNNCVRKVDDFERRTINANVDCN